MDLIAKFVDPSGLRELEEVQKSLDGITNTIDGLHSKSINIELNMQGATNLKEFIAQSKELVKINKELSAQAVLLEKVKTQEAKTAFENSKSALNEARAKESLAKADEILNRQRERSIRNAEKNSKTIDAEAGSINKLRHELKLATSAYDALSKAERENVQVGGAMLKSIQDTTKELSTLESLTGRNQRNVGNYKSAFDGLGHSVQQIARELPSLTNGFNQFFLAISNNLPMAIDEFKRAVAVNKALQAEGKATTSVFKQVMASVISWQTALVVAITLLSAYGKDIIAFFSDIGAGTNKASDGTKILTNETKILSEVYKNAATTYAKAASEIDILRTRFFDAAATAKDKSEVIKTLNKNYEDTIGKINGVNEAEDFFINRSEAFVKALMLRAQIEGAYQTIAENTTTLLKQQATTVEDNVGTLQKYNNFLVSFSNTYSKGLAGGKVSWEMLQKDIDKQNQASAKRNTSNVQNAVERSNNIIKGFILTTGRELDDLNKKFDFGSGRKEGKTKADASTVSNERELRSKINEENIKIAAQELERDKRQQEAIFNNEKNSLDDRIAARWLYHTDVLALQELEAQSALRSNQIEHDANIKAINETKTSNEKKNELITLENRRFAETNKAIIEEMTTAQLDSLQDYVDKGIKWTNDEEDKLHKDRIKRADEIAKTNADNLERIWKEQDDKEKEEDDAAKRRSKELKYYGEAFMSVGKIVNDQLDARIDALQREADQLQYNHDLEIQLINASAKSQEEKEKATRDQVAKTRDLLEDNNRRQIELERQKAIFNKAAAVAAAVINTAVAVTALLEFPPLAIAAGVAGAAQVAAIIAQPLPQFFKGTEASPEGLAWVGEKGRELTIDRRGNVGLTPDSATMTYLEQGTKIIPNDKTEQILADAQRGTLTGAISYMMKKANGNKDVVDAIGNSSDKIVRALSNKPSNAPASAHNDWFRGYYYAQFKSKR